MTGQYAFPQTTEGRTYFARAWVEAVPSDSCGEIENALPEATELGSGEVSRRAESPWVDAALEGMKAAAAGASQEAGNCYRLRLVRLLGTVADTTPDAVWCAAALAAWA